MHVYYFDIQKLIDRVQYESMMKAKNIKSDSGESQVDAMGVNDEDKAYVKNLLRDAAGKVFYLLSPYSRGMRELEEPVEPFEFDVAYDENPGMIVFRVNWPATFDANLSPLIDQAIHNAMVNYCKSDFLNKIGADGRPEAADYQANMKELRMYLGTRNRYKRTYKLY